MPLTPLKVLIADDSPIIVQRIRDLISDMEFVSSIGYANDGRETLALVEYMNPDVVILDIKMPGLNGLQVLDEIRKQQNHVKVILFTNHTDEYFKTQCLQRGADFFLDKSTDFELIPEILKMNLYRAIAS
ncbi:MAG: response regulator transcription factor [Bacteroidetes bacterium]|jgi:two-component system chemotaxis response regulator CheB/two-component system response regulator YesN|nr:response regulator transcription factor [Bacteroidota bacterium]MBP6402601.1 response regulator transcription factor [Bacteroidia bacterium]MBK9525843.1 response regulator transcription factor [Bacteroidota bacterium]MBK9543240.1 response regulator transcription factor [Bacteroidota bacterium]MBL0258105.1 response regulator transcription factor [Bacteroidota bacterium]